MHLAVHRVLVALLGAQVVDDQLDVLAAFTAGHHHRVGRLDHDHVVQADGADQPAGGVYQGVGRVLDDHVADAGVAKPVLGRDLPDRFPGAEVVPASVQRDHPDLELAARTFLHHRVVDRLARYRGKLGLARADELGVVAARSPSLARGRGDVGAEALERSHPHRCLEHEHPGVPEVAAIGDIALRGGQVGLFDKLRYRRRRVGGACIDPDVAVAGLGGVWGDAQDRDRTAIGHPHRALQCCAESGLVGDGLVGRGDDEHRILAVLERGQRCQRDGWCGVAAHRLEQRGGGLDPQRVQLVEHQKAVLLVADDDRPGDGDALGGQAAQPRHRLLEQAVLVRRVARQHQKLLRVTSARQGPQPGAGTAGHDHGLDQDVHVSKPLGLFVCQRQLSAHMRFRSCLACQPSRLLASAGSA